MLFVIVSFVLSVFAVDAKGWVSRLGLFALALVLGITGVLMVVMTDKPLVIEWLVLWMTRP